MIDVKELRIGNLLQRISNGSVCQVNWGIIRDAELGMAIDYALIPLTEERLVRFGFKRKYEDGSEWYHFPVSALTLLFFNDGLCDVYWHGRKIREIKYVHQLQNLYHALTGKELEMKQA